VASIFKPRLFILDSLTFDLGTKKKYGHMELFCCCCSVVTVSRLQCVRSRTAVHVLVYKSDGLARNRNWIPLNLLIYGSFDSHTHTCSFPSFNLLLMNIICLIPPPSSLPDGMDEWIRLNNTSVYKKGYLNIVASRKIHWRSLGHLSSNLLYCSPVSLVWD